MGSKSVLFSFTSQQKNRRQLNKQNRIHALTCPQFLLVPSFLMQAWISAEKTPSLHAAIKKDLSKLLGNFVNKKAVGFDIFKGVWTDIGLSKLHHLCPGVISPSFFLQIIYQNGKVCRIISALHHNTHHASYPYITCFLSFGAPS